MHPSKAKWNDYIARRLPVAQYEQYEMHLYTCDECLFVYMTCINEQASDMPQLHDEEAFTEKVMTSIRKEKSPAARQEFYKRTIVHYGAAAIVTLMLMTTGTFQGMLSLVSDVESLTATEQRASLSDHLMERAGSVLDSFDVTTRRDRHE